MRHVGRGWGGQGKIHTGIVADGVGAVILLFVMRIRKAHFRWDANLFSLLGLPVFAYLLLRSRLFHGRGKVSWKGRLYDGEASQGDNRTIQKAAKTEITPAAPYHPYDLSHAQSRIRRFPLLPQSGVHTGGEPARLRQVQQPERARPQLHTGSNGEGEIDPRSGFVVDLKQLKGVLTREVLDAMDHRFLNREVPEFANQIPTTENLAIAIWQRLEPKLKAAQLHRVRVYETPDFFVDFFGEA